MSSMNIISEITIDFDDFTEEDNALDLFFQLKAINPSFKCSVFTPTSRVSVGLLKNLPGWIQTCAHGELHTEREFSCISYESMIKYLNNAKNLNFMHYTFKAPNWDLSPDGYLALKDRGWAVADHPKNEEKWPIGLNVYNHTRHASWHGHINDVCDNGIRKDFERLRIKVRQTDLFWFVTDKWEVYNG